MDFGQISPPKLPPLGPLIEPFNNDPREALRQIYGPPEPIQQQLTDVTLPSLPEDFTAYDQEGITGGDAKQSYVFGYLTYEFRIITGPWRPVNNPRYVRSDYQVKSGQNKYGWQYYVEATWPGHSGTKLVVGHRLVEVRNLVFSPDPTNPVAPSPARETERPDSPNRTRPAIPLEPLPTPEFLEFPSPRFLPSGGVDLATVPGIEPAPDIPAALVPAPTREPEREPMPPIAPPPPPPFVPTEPGDDDDDDPPRVPGPIVVFPELGPSTFEQSDLTAVTEQLLEQLEEIRQPPRTLPGACLCVDEIRTDGQRTRDLLEDLLDGEDDQQSLTLERAVCDQTTDPPQDALTAVQVESLESAIQLLASEIAQIRLSLGVCPPAAVPQASPSVLASGTSTESKTTEYVEIDVQVRQVELIITGQIPTAFRLYRNDPNGEMQGKFGNLCIAYPGSTGGFAPDAFQQWAWTRRTILDVGSPLRNPRYVRIFVRPGLSWVLYDTGLRN